jgi:hypothetical protein
MASAEVILISSILSSDESSKIPEDVQKKIECYIKNKSEETVVAKALLETTRGNLGQYLCRGSINLNLVEECISFVSMGNVIGIRKKCM